MRKITVTVKHKTYRDTRAWCARRDTSISHLVQAFLNDLPRLEDVRRFPLPDAPHPQSLGALYNDLEDDKLEMLRLTGGRCPPSPSPPCDCVEGINHMK